jgi:hypothetical protein
MPTYHYGLNIDPANSHANPSVDELSDLGVQIVRYSYKAHRNADVAYADRARAYSAVGIDSLIILTGEALNRQHPEYGLPMATLNNIDTVHIDWDLYLTELAGVAGNIARNFPEGTAIQIWNEPDLTGEDAGYRPQIAKPAYAAMLDRLNSV